MTKRANTWPVKAPTVALAVTRIRFTALSISSTAISSRIALRRRSTP